MIQVRSAGSAFLFLVALAGKVDCQSARFSPQLSAQATFAAIHVDPVPGGRSANQFVLEMPVAMLHAAALNNRLVLHAALDLEGWTMPHGVLGLGTWGEGFNDRRHPHTYVHEAMLAWTQRGRQGRFLPLVASISIGKGYVAFGSEDPMNRPALGFPVNHHWSQILERAAAIAGVRAGPLSLEASLFNGDEPEYPGQWPLLKRFGDSWAGRATVVITRGFELEASYAKVRSPEHRPGAATDQHKWHASGRLDRPIGSGGLKLLAEWARTSEASGFFVFRSALGEAAWTRAEHRVYYRFERTDRPEEERTLDPFRSVRPHLENSILGTTRWSVHTAGVNTRAATLGRVVHIEPILELAYARVSDRQGGLFSANGFYGRNSLWSGTLAVRVVAGNPMRMGRYGVAEETSSHGMRMR